MNRRQINYGKKILILAITSITIFALALPGFTASSSHNTAVIVQGSSSEEVAQLVESYGGEVTSYLEIIDGVGATISEETIAQLLAEPLISSITSDATVSLTEGDKHGDDDEDKGEDKKDVPATNYPDVTGADIAWESGATGAEVTVAIVDTGIDPKTLFSKDKKADEQLIGWVDFVNNKKKPHDPNGHG
ncbi:MAG: hypothetical protein U9O54_01925, partial [Chloroflexota bacterium]|nr:hypothetical protein [Chloroflexota bacterium]